MSRQNLIVVSVLSLFLYLQTSICFAEKLTLRMIDQQEGTSRFYHDLLKSSLEAVGHNLEIIKKGDIPQKRSVAMFETGKIDIIVLLRTPERKQKYTDVNIDLTSGMMGERVLFIPPETVTDYRLVQTLEDFRRSGKVGAFGANWFDEQVWRHNDLPYYVVDGDWRSIYKRLLSPPLGNIRPPFDYFSRSVTEIGLEAKFHPELAIEPNLLLKYDRDFHFYLNEKSAHLKPLLEAALTEAIKSGLHNKILTKHFSAQLSSLNLKSRTVIHLSVPE